MAQHIEVAHEALIQNWPRLDDWLDQDRDYLLWRQSLRPFVTLWKTHQNDPDTLLRGTLLQTALNWERQRSEDLGPDEKFYIAESRVLESQLQHEKARRRRLNVSSISAVTALVIACFMIGLMASLSSNKTKSASNYLGQASLREQRGEYGAAINDYTAALKLNPNLPSAYLGRARVYYLEGGEANYRNAIADYNEFFRLVGDSISGKELAIAYDGRGQAYLRVNDLINAESDFTFALGLDQNFALASYDLGSLLAKKGQFDEAIKYFTQAINTKEGFYSAYLGRGKAYFTRGKTLNQQNDIESALSDFTKAQFLKDEEAEPYLRIGLIHYERKDYKSAIESYENALRYENQYGEASNALGEAYVQTGQLDKAISAFKDAVGDRYVQAHYNLGLAYKAKGELDNAINSLQAFISNPPYNSPDISEAFLVLGEAFALKGEHEAAIQNYSIAISIEPQAGDAYFSRGESYFKTGDKAKAISDLLTYLKSPTNETRLYQARQYLEQLDFVPPTDAVQIYLHYNKTIDPALLGKVEAALDQRFDKIKRIQGDADLASIRFFQNSFRTHAKNIRDIVQSVYASNNTPQNFQIGKFPDSTRKDAYGWIEIWLPVTKPPASTPAVVPNP